MVLLLLVGFSVVSGVIGALIGETRGRTFTGFVLGLFLGVIGWIITALLGPSDDEVRRRNQELAWTMAAANRAMMPAPIAASSWSPNPAAATVPARFLQVHDGVRSQEGDVLYVRSLRHEPSGQVLVEFVGGRTQSFPPDFVVRRA